jgi:hypothetical protein
MLVKNKEGKQSRLLPPPVSTYTGDIQLLTLMSNSLQASPATTVIARQLERNHQRFTASDLQQAIYSKSGRS